MAKISKFILFYLVQAACLWIGVQASIYFQGDALKIFLQDYWLFFYAIPLVTTGFIFHEIKDIPLSALIGWTDRQCLVVYSEGKKSWQYNQVTYFLRRRN